MKNLWKWALVGGGGLVVVLLGFMFWPRPDNAGRLPTLPTPPGVSVPPGMRYVGGDEFDEGAKPDEKRWSRGVIGGSRTATTVENGCLVIRGADEKSLQIWDLQKKFRRGRVEVRMRFSPGGGRVGPRRSDLCNIPPFAPTR